MYSIGYIFMFILCYTNFEVIALLDSEIISIVIKKERKKRKMSQEVLSGLAGLNRVHYSNIERNLRCPSINTLFKISYALGLKPHELVLLIENELDK